MQTLELNVKLTVERLKRATTVRLFPTGVKHSSVLPRDGKNIFRDRIAEGIGRRSPPAAVMRRAK